MDTNKPDAEVSVHLINHTHWDREWFLTHEYTTAWIPALIDSLEGLAANNTDYEFLFDGQTLAIEDLLGTQPDYRDRVKELISEGQLNIGPCYSQPDWRITGGELQIRNLTYGMSDARSLGGAPDVAWLVDTFGHISQAPQMLTLAGVTAAYVWRGVPMMTPLFNWRGPDGTVLATIDLFGGYRNLYGVTKTPEIAVHRLVAEAQKLAPSYGDLPVPLFDGYDLDTEPEDPALFYADLDVPETVTITASSPRRYAESLNGSFESAPTIAGELISGKYGSTFPGSLSARTYLKMMQDDGEKALHRKVEPLAAIARAGGHDVDFAPYERVARTLLQNAVHDAICGVSIDQVHERMDRSYGEMLAWANDEVARLTRTIVGGFAPGTYAVSTFAMPARSVVRAGSAAAKVATSGVGVTAVERLSEIRAVGEPVEDFSWTNDHYGAVIDQNGLRLEGGGRLARLVMWQDDGDTYSSEPGQRLGELTLDGPLIHLDETDFDTTLRSQWKLDDGAGLTATTTVDMRFDSGPLIHLDITLDSTGTEFRIEAEFDTGIRADTVHASMPFDVVERSHTDTDLLETELDAELTAVLMGQREVGRVTEFPFHDFVALADETSTRAVLAKGLRSYRSDANGMISVTLRRSAEWLAKTGLALRSGDAGPAMYVPGARCERVVNHRIAFGVFDGPIATSSIHTANETFHNPPVIATVVGTPSDAPTEWVGFSENLPLTALIPADGDPVVRMFNPTDQAQELSNAVRRCSLFGTPEASISTVAPREILTGLISLSGAPSTNTDAIVDVLSTVEQRVGPSRSRPHPGELEGLTIKIKALTAQLADNTRELEATTDEDDRYRLTHREYVLDRERRELQLSLELNNRLLASTDTVSIPDEADPVIADLGVTLNDLRVRRRIYDYVVQALN